MGGGEPHQGWLPLGAAEPPEMPVYPISLVIEENESGVFLFMETPRGKFDSWHRTFTDAAREAKVRFDVVPEEWQLVEDS
jgi:hypothetical protein